MNSDILIQISESFISVPQFTTGVNRNPVNIFKQSSGYMLESTHEQHENTMPRSHYVQCTDLLKGLFPLLLHCTSSNS